MTSHSLCGSISGHFHGVRTRYPNTFIDYQGGCKRKLLALAPDSRALGLAAIFGHFAKRTHSDSLGGRP